LHAVFGDLVFVSTKMTKISARPTKRTMASSLHMKSKNNNILAKITRHDNIQTSRRLSYSFRQLQI